MCLYGHEIDDTTTPWEAGLGWICKPAKGEFLGRDVLVRQKEKGIERTLAGFEMLDRMIARDACTVSINGKEAGRVTSGSPAPFLKKNVGMAYVPVASKAPGTEIAIGIRANQAPARIVPMPFYKRSK
jgi:aminomethyltransferase